MNDARFRELLNLYLDRRLTPAEAAELETEVMSRPDRRRLYNDYCRMQRACRLLFEDECKNAPASFALAKALREIEGKINGTPAAASQSGAVVWLRWSGGLAAACVVVVSATVFLNRPAGDVGIAEVAEQSVDAPPGLAVRAEPATAVAEPVVMVAAAGPAQTVVIPAHIALAAIEPSAEAVQQSRLAAQRWIDDEAEALNASHLTADGRFEIHHVRNDSGVPSFTTAKQTASWRGELTSYQFQR